MEKEAFERTRTKVYQYVVHYKAEHDGISPTMREIGAALHLAHSNVYHHLQALERAGQLKFIGVGQSRGIMVRGGQWSAPGGSDV